MPSIVKLARRCAQTPEWDRHTAQAAHPIMRKLRSTTVKKQLGALGRRGLKMTAHRDPPTATTTRSKRATRRSARRDLLAALPAQVAHAQAHRRRSPSSSAGVDAAADHHARSARAPAGDAQDRAARAPEGAARRQRRSVRRLLGDRLARPARRAARAACSSRPGRSTSPRAQAPTTGAWRARMLRRGLSRRRPGAQQLQLPPDAGRLDDGKRRARARLHRVRRRRRQHRAAVAGDRRPAARTATSARRAS